MLIYKAELVGIKVIVTEESYTSKCSFIDSETLEKQSSYKGTRVKRGLFRNQSGILINADCNGSGNIIRKVVPNAFVEGIQGVVVHPVRITPHK
ncbi:zinc ribbon domain-containing protein [Moorena sp. SIO3H5]|uniref:zinc ribbon domain-containing protein n=1 Tax=Moorena sp. SIO3H5 TaxID=2607834 RepID=UPI0025CD5580|nr:zinc ribbon domain-containing protein [Moorena sp. SIO3H5]